MLHLKAITFLRGRDRMATLAVHVIGVRKPHHLAFPLQRVVTFGAFAHRITRLPYILSTFEDMMAFTAFQPIVFNVPQVRKRYRASPSGFVAFAVDDDLVGRIRRR
jgi:hypothetical protein